MSEIITNRFVTHEGLQDYDMLLKSWLPDISLAGTRDDGATTYKKIEAAATALYTYNHSNYDSLFGILSNRHRGVFVDTLKNGASSASEYNNSGDAEFNKLRYQHSAFVTFKPHSDEDNTWRHAFTTLFVPRGYQSFKWYTRWWDPSVENEDGPPGAYRSKTHTLLDTANINTASLVGVDTGQYPVSKINTTILASSNNDDVNYLLWGSYVDNQGAPYRLQDVTFNPKADTLSAPTVSATKFNIKTENQFLDNGLYGFDAHNSDIINVNSIYMNDLANDPKEGILWLRGSGISDVPAQVESGDQAQNSYSADILTAYKGGLYFLPDFSYRLPKKKDRSDEEKWPIAKYQIITSESSQRGEAAPETHEVFSAYTDEEQNLPRPIWVSGIGSGAVRKDGVICPADDLTYNSYTKTLTADTIAGFNIHNGIQIESADSLNTAIALGTVTGGFAFSLGQNYIDIFKGTDYTVQFGKWEKGFVTRGATGADAAYWVIDSASQMRFGYINNGTYGKPRTVISDTNINPALITDGNKISVRAGGQTSTSITVPFATNATTATNLSSNPALNASGNTITVTAGNKTSSAFTVPYASKAGSANTATDAEYIKIGTKYYSVAFNSNGTLILTAKE